MSRLIVVFFLSAFMAYGQDCGEVPTHGQKIAQLAKKKLRKKVGRGECWDLAQYVLNETNSDWDGYEVYGRKFNRKKECIFPGDIIQFDKVKIKYTEGNITYMESMKHHTAVVYKVINKNEIVILHQNTAEFGRKVGKSTLRFDTVTSGKMIFYRPVKKSDA